MMTTINKKTSKILALLMICVLAAACFSGCADKKSNEKPELVGAGDFECIVNEQVDLLRRVSALDREDGDITPQMTIEISPAVTINNGVVVFPKTGEYTVTYSVTDSDGNTTTEETFVTASERRQYKSFALMDDAGFTVDVDGDAELVSQSVTGDGDGSVLNFKVTGAKKAEDVALARYYAMESGAEYKFAYTLKSKTSGKIKAVIGENETEFDLEADTEETVEFTYEVPENEDYEEVEEEVKLLCGALGNEIEITFIKAVAEHDGNLTRGVALAGKKVVTLNNVHDRFDATEGKVTVSEDKKSATLKITKPAGPGDMWKGGMFIDTGVALKADVDYTVSFDIAAEEDSEFAVIVQNRQWDERKYAEQFMNAGSAEANTGYREITFRPTAESENSLWLYVQSGQAINTVTIANIEVYESVYARFDGAQGSVVADEDTNAATLEITEAADAIYKGGMFINTSVRLRPGRKCTVGFDLTAETDEDFEIVFQNKRWDEARYHTEVFDKGSKAENSGRKEITFTTEDSAEGLWLYVQSGNAVNKITVSDIVVTYNDHVTETLGYSNVFKMFAKEGAPNYAVWKDGKLVFTVEKFGDTDWHNKIQGPDFDMGTGKFGDYYVSFKAKATSPVQLTVVGPVSGGWDPNMIWARFDLTDTETLYTIRTNEMGTPAIHHFEWQFGTPVNQKYENVTIEISEIKICYKSEWD